MLNFNPFPVLESDRILLCRLDNSHLHNLHAYLSQKKNFEFVEMNVHVTIDETERYVQKMNKGIDENKWIIWAICSKENKIMGTISIWNFDETNSKAELGYGIFPEFRGNGYMLEALNLVIGYAFNRLNLETIEAYTSVKNEPSNALLKKMNFEYVKTFEDEYSNNQLMNVYSMSK